MMRRRDWVETEGTVWSVLDYQTKAGSAYEVVVSYKVDGHYYSSTFTTMAYHHKDERIAVRYDPKNPEKNNFSAREGILRWVYTVFFIAMGVMVIYLMMQPKVK